MTEREQNALVAALAGTAVLAGPKRTRPLAGFLYGLFLSRAQGASRRRLEDTVLRLFDQRRSVVERVSRLKNRMIALEARVEKLEAKPLLPRM